MNFKKYIETNKQKYIYRNRNFRFLGRNKEVLVIQYYKHIFTISVMQVRK